MSNNSPIIDRLLAKTRRTDLPDFKPGDTVRVHVKIKEGDKERLQAFEGVVISKSHGDQPSFTVRKMSFGQGVERIFPTHSKVIDKIEVLRSAHVRRTQHFDLVDDLRVGGEDALDALPKAHLAHGEAGLVSVTLGNDDTFESLQALLVAFLDLHVDPDGVAGLKVR